MLDVPIPHPPGRWLKQAVAFHSAAPTRALSNPTRWPVAINSGLQRAAPDPCQFSSLSISGASAPSSAESSSELAAQSFFATPMVGTSTNSPKWLATPRRRGWKYRDHPQRTIGFCELLHAASNAGYSRKEEKAGDIRHGGGDARHCIQPVPARDISQNHRRPRHLSALFKPHVCPPIRSADRHQVDPRITDEASSSC